MTNGIIDISAGGIKHRLRFGRLAYEHFMLKQAKVSGTTSRMTIDLVHAGLINHADSIDEPYPKRLIAVDICESIWSSTDSDNIIQSVWDTFFESRDGKRFAPDSKKKANPDMSGLDSEMNSDDQIETEKEVRV